MQLTKLQIAALPKGKTPNRLWVRAFFDRKYPTLRPYLNRSQRRKALI